MKLDSVLASFLTTMVCALAGLVVFGELTGGMRLFTTESWRRASVVSAPRAVPDVAMQDQEGHSFRFKSLCGRVMVIDFIYTRCPTVCKAVGAATSEIARRLETIEGLEDAVVLSVSFDPSNDGPPQLRSFKRRMEPGSPTSWRLARLLDEDEARGFMKTFGVVAIADGSGGYDHNASIHVLDRSCRLRVVLDEFDTEGAVAAALRLR